MIEDALRQRGFKVSQDSKGILVTVPSGRNFENALDEVERLAQKHEYNKTISVAKEGALW